MKVNGETVELVAGCSLKTFLEQRGYVINRIAVEHNGEIVPKSMYEACVLNDYDTLEIVHFVGGG